MEHAYTHARILTGDERGGRIRGGHQSDGPSGGRGVAGCRVAPVTPPGSDSLLGLPYRGRANQAEACGRDEPAR
ncbi:hypothetical protein, partial [Streptomyces sp. SID5789]|uniref:hypothetical protein n=1 Tax=Streptomyces sp. SID5789 TaxID=2690310 RepID=UPI001F2AAFF4